MHKVGTKRGATKDVAIRNDVTYLGLDNGNSGTTGIVNDSGMAAFFHIPVRSEISHTKKKANITRIDFPKLVALFERVKAKGTVRLVLEGPYINGLAFNASIISARVFEATLIAIEQVQLPYVIITAQSWQKAMLPTGTKGRKEQKKASSEIGTRLFPQFAEKIKKHGDADGLLIAEYARRNRL